MGESAIEWTQHTWNPVVGCDRISPGCAHCYAKGLHDTRHAAYVAGKPMAEQYAHPFETIQLKPERLGVPLRRRAPTTYFVNSVSDLFHEDVPEALVDQVFAAMALTPAHTYQVLTKRPARMRAYLVDGRRHEVIVEAMDQPSWLPAGRRFPRIPENWPLPNVWLGVSVENQHFADERIPLLLETPAAVRFISAEPLLGPIDFSMNPAGQVLEDCDECGLRRPNPECDACSDAPPALDWVIVGGESGPRARPCRVAWVRSIVQQCQAARCPVFVKQLGAVVIDRNDAGFMGDEPDHWPEDLDVHDRIEHDLDGTRDNYQGAPVRVHLASRKGGDIAEWPADLRVRQMPEVQ